MNFENSLSNSFFSWGIVFFSSLAIAIPNDCVRLELSEDVLQDSSYAAYIGEGIQATYLSFRTLNHGLATVNTHTPCILRYMDVLAPLSGRTTAERYL